MENKQAEDFEKDIVSFDQAIELATLEFDKQTLCGYDIADRQLYLCQVDEDGIYMPQKDLAAPTKGQVFRWFREKYRLYSTIIFRVSMEDNNEYWDWLIKGEEVVYRHFKTYEEAEKACIEKLLELAKQQDK